MTVNELIEELKKYRSNIAVIANDGSEEGYTCPVNEVRLVKVPYRDGTTTSYVKIMAEGWPIC